MKNFPLDSEGRELLMLHIINSQSLEHHWMLDLACGHHDAPGNWRMLQLSPLLIQS